MLYSFLKAAINIVTIAVRLQCNLLQFVTLLFYCEPECVSFKMFFNNIQHYNNTRSLEKQAGHKMTIKDIKRPKTRRGATLLNLLKIVDNSVSLC